MACAQAYLLKDLGLKKTSVMIKIVVPKTQIPTQTPIPRPNAKVLFASGHETKSRAYSAAI